MKKKLLILGAGFGGMYCYRSLSKKVRDYFDVSIIDQNEYFLFTPLLHEVATGVLDPESIIEPITDILNPCDTYIQARVSGLDLESKHIIFENGTRQEYDVLVIGLGSKTNFYNTPGSDQHCYELKNLDDALAIRNHFEEQFKTQSQIPFPEQQEISTCIVGGGPTGVELAGEIADLFWKTYQKKYSDTIDFSKVSIKLVNASSSLLKPYSLGAQKYAQEILEKKNVQILNDTSITEVKETNVLVHDGSIIQATTVIWTAGVSSEKISGIESFLHLDKRVEVKESLQLNTYPEVFVVGDMARIIDGEGAPYPMLAQIAKRQGILVAKNIELLLQNQEPLAFSYREKGKLASLGQWDAIAELPSVQLYGHIAWFVWRTIYLFNFPSYGKRWSIMLDWTKKLIFPKRISHESNMHETKE